jgi:hypothetical protein
MRKSNPGSSQDTGEERQLECVQDISRDRNMLRDSGRSLNKQQSTITGDLRQLKQIDHLFGKLPAKQKCFDQADKTFRPITGDRTCLSDASRRVK